MIRRKASNKKTKESTKETLPKRRLIAIITNYIRIYCRYLRLPIWLITWRSLVQIQAPLPILYRCNMPKTYYCYILRSESINRFYVGISENVDQRLIQHNQGQSIWTKNKGPWKLLWKKEFSSLRQARAFENLLKRQKGGKGLYRLTRLTQESGS